MFSLPRGTEKKLRGFKKKPRLWENGTKVRLSRWNNKISIDIWNPPHCF